MFYFISIFHYTRCVWYRPHKINTLQAARRWLRSCANGDINDNDYKLKKCCICNTRIFGRFIHRDSMQSRLYITPKFIHHLPIYPHLYLSTVKTRIKSSIYLYIIYLSTNLSTVSCNLSTEFYIVIHIYQINNNT